MKTNYLSLLNMGRSLVRLKDRTGAYKLPTGNQFPKFGPSGRQRVVHPSAVRAPGSAEQANLFEKKTKAADVAAAQVLSAPKQAVASPKMQKKPVAAGASVFGSFLSKGFFAAAGIWGKVCELARWGRTKIRLPRIFDFGSGSRVIDSRPRAQAELALEKVTVLRNDLSEADVVVVNVDEKKLESQTSEPPRGGAEMNPWTRATARWMKQKSPAAKNNTNARAEQPAQLAELQP